MAVQSSFSALKKNNSVESLIKTMEKENSSKSYEDSRQWKPIVDANGNGFAIIRFLPPPKDEADPWIIYYNHAFKNPLSGKWFIENCPTSIGENCPVCKKSQKLWNTGIESDKVIVRSRKRQKKYVSNIYVIQDPKNPENEGKVFLYTYGTKIFEKIKSCLEPEFPDAEAFSPFDFWTGANFRLKIKNVAKQRSYDSSSFDAPTALSGDDEVLEKIWNCQYPLVSSFLNPKHYKSYEILEKNFLNVIDEESSSSSTLDNRYEAKTKEEPKKATVASSEDTSAKYKEFLNKFKDSEDEAEEEELF